MPGNIADLQAFFGKLMSACIGDLSSLLVPDEKSALDQASDSDGTESKQGGAFGMRMHREAGLDVQKFLFLALGGEGAINRNMTAYASVLWMMLILERSMGHEKDVMVLRVEESIAYVLKNANRVHVEMQTNGNQIDTFLLAFIKFQETRPSQLTYSATDSISWHNYRTLQSPTAEIFKNGPKYHSFSLVSVIAVLQKCGLLPDDFKVETLRVQLAADESCVEGKGKYYDLDTQVWPIAEFVIAGADGVHGRNVPIPEADLHPAMLKILRCWFIRTSRLDALRDLGSQPIDISPDKWKGVVITDSALGIADYNFFEMVSGQLGFTWAGYGALRNSQWGQFCLDDRLMAGNYTSGLAPVVEDGLDAVEVMDEYHPSNLVNVFGYNRKHSGYSTVITQNPFLFKDEFDEHSGGVVDELAERHVARSDERRIPGSNPQDDNSEDLQEVSGGEEEDEDELDVRDEEEYDPLGANNDDPVSLSLN